MYVQWRKVMHINAYHISQVNSHSYYKFQVEMGAATNWEFIIEIARKA